MTDNLFHEIADAQVVLRSKGVFKHAKLRAAGCSVFTLDSTEAVDQYIAQRTS